MRALARPEVRYLTFGVACCSMELFPLLLERYRPEHLHIRPARWFDDANVLVVAGAINERLAGVVRGMYERMPEPKWVVAFSGCSCGGGPYTEGPNVLDGVDTVIPVDLYVPGAPPRPEAFIYAMLKIQELMAHGRHVRSVDRTPFDASPWRT